MRDAAGTIDAALRSVNASAAALWSYAAAAAPAAAGSGGQRVEAVEAVVVDDASGDGGAAAVRRFADSCAAGERGGRCAGRVPAMTGPPLRVNLDDAIPEHFSGGTAGGGLTARCTGQGRVRSGSASAS